MAGRIVAYRHRHGSFGSVDDLLKVGGLGPATLAKVRESLAVE
jgi:competence ComEA-like helix-hairpin-helix protein